jgi:hypothetical protein
MFRVGQKVVCVNDKIDPSRNLPSGIIYPKRNNTYTIRGIYLGVNGETALLLEEIYQPYFHVNGQEIGFSSSRFRSLVEDGMIEELLSRIIEEVKEEILVEEEIGITD